MSLIQLFATRIRIRNTAEPTASAVINVHFTQEVHILTGDKIRDLMTIYSIQFNSIHQAI